MSQSDGGRADDDLVGELTPEEAAAVGSVLARVGRTWWLVLLLGVVSVIVGVLMFLHPFEAVAIAAVIFGLWLLVSGVFQLVRAFDSGMDSVTRVLSAIAGVIGIILGIVCFESVGDRLELLVLFIGIWWIMRGIVQVIAGSDASPADGFMIFLGILGILAGIIVLMWNIDSLPVLAVISGIWLVLLGIIEIIASFRVRSLRGRASARSAG